MTLCNIELITTLTASKTRGLLAIRGQAMILLALGRQFVVTCRRKPVDVVFSLLLRNHFFIQSRSDFYGVATVLNCIDT